MKECICGQPISSAWNVCPDCGADLKKDDLLRYQVEMMGLCPNCGLPVAGKNGCSTPIRFSEPYRGWACHSCGHRWLTVRLIVMDPANYLLTAQRYNSTKELEKKLESLKSRRISTP